MKMQIFFNVLLSEKLHVTWRLAENDVGRQAENNVTGTQGHKLWTGKTVYSDHGAHAQSQKEVMFSPTESVFSKSCVFSDHGYLYHVNKH